MTRYYRFAFYSLLLAGYFLLRLPALEGGPSLFIDTAGYADLADRPFWSREFLCGTQPPVLPLVYKLMGKDFNGIVQVQWGLAGFCWIALAAIVARAISVPWVKRLGALTILAFSLSSNIVMWDRNLLTESLSISLLVLFIACWLLIFMKWHWSKAVAIIFLALLLSLLRDANAYSIIMLACLLTILVLVKCADKRYLILAAAFIVIFTASQVSTNQGKRWVFPFFDVVGQRILSSQQRTDYFALHGMPVSDALMQRAGKWAYSDDEAFFRSTELSTFRKWADEKGKTSYARYLLEHPGYLFLLPLPEWKEIFFGDLPYAAAPFRPLLPAWLNDLLYPSTPVVLCLILAGFTALAAVTRVFRKEWNVSFSMLLIAILSGLLAWHADSQEIARHSVSAAIQVRLGVWLLLLFLLDEIVSRAREMAKMGSVRAG